MNDQNKKRPSLFKAPLFKSPAASWLTLTALALLLAVAVNLLIFLLPASVTRIDMTAQHLTGLSDVSVDYVKALEEEVTLHYICITGNEDESVRTLLERYDELSDKLTVKQVDPAVHPTFVAGYTDRELSDNSIIVESAKRRKVLDYTDLLLYTVYATEDGSSYTPIGEMIYADFELFYETYADYFAYGTYTYEVAFAGEGTVTSAIDYAVGDLLPKVYTVTGHGETALSDAMLSYLSLDNIDYADLALNAVDALPEDADCLIVNAPQIDLSEKEADLLRAYLLGGGNLILLTDYAGVELPVLMELMEEFGMTAESGVLREGDPSRYYSLPYFLLPDTAGAASIYDLSSYTLLMPYAHPIAMTESEYTLTYTSLFRTSDKTLLEPIEEEDSEGEASDSTETPEAQYDVGARVLLSTDQGSGQLCWLASPTMLLADYNNAVSGGNYTYFLTILEDMCDKSGSLAIAAKPLTDSPLLLSNGQAAFWAVVLIGLIPIAIATVGIVIRERRKRR